MVTPSAPSAPAAPPPYDEILEKRTQGTQEPTLYPNVNAFNRVIPPNSGTVRFQMFPAMPIVTVCPVCNETITTAVKYSNGTFTYVMAFFCGLFFLCCCIPLCCKGFKDVNHFCPKCKAYIGTNRRI